MKGLTDSDTEKNLLTLATKVAELQEQQRTLLTKSNELEKRTTTYTRERDHISLENSRIIAAKTKLESLCRELHKHNQQIRVISSSKQLSCNDELFFFWFHEESAQQQREDEAKRRELATKFQVNAEYGIRLYDWYYLFRQQLMKLLLNSMIIVRNRPHYVNKIFNYLNNYPMLWKTTNCVKR